MLLSLVLGQLLILPLSNVIIITLKELLLAGVLFGGFARLTDLNLAGKTMFRSFVNYLNFTIGPGENSLDFNFTVCQYLNQLN